MGTNMNVYMTNVSINHQIKPRKVRITISMNVSSTYITYTTYKHYYIKYHYGMWKSKL